MSWSLLAVLGNGQLLCLNSRQSAVGRRLFCLLIAQIFAQALNAELMAKRDRTTGSAGAGANGSGSGSTVTAVTRARPQYKFKY